MKHYSPQVFTAALKASGLTMAQLADKAGVSVGLVHKMTQPPEGYCPRADVADRIAAILGIDSLLQAS